MPCGNALPPAGAHLNALSTTTAYEWLTDWLAAIGLDVAKIAFKARNISGNIQMQPCLQVALVRTDKPGSATTLGSPVTANGETCTGELTVSGQTGGQMYVRFGVAYSLTSGSALGQADYAMAVQTKQCGQVSGSWSGHVDCVSATDEKIYAISGWLPSLLVDKIEVAGIIGSHAGNAQMMVCYRTATTSTEAPSAWSTSPDLEAAWHTADGEFNSGELALSITTVQWVQIGLRVKNSSGSALGQMDVSTTTCVRKT